MSEETVKIANPELQMLLNNKTDGYNYQERRHEDWLENYTLSRDKVTTNRLTQRQSVNLPLMKTVIKTTLKDIDDMPVMFFENLDNDKQAEIFKNEYWKLTGDEDHNKFEILDIIDKRQVIHFGRSYDTWQIMDGKVVMSIEDTMDILVSRFTDPHNIHSSRFLTHWHIFKPLSKLKQNPDYNKKAIEDLETWYGTEQGIIKVKQNAEALLRKNEKMAKMGVIDIDNPILGEAVIEISLHFVWRDSEAGYGPQIFLYVEADDQQILMKKPLEEVIGVTSDHFWRTHYPYNSWADDVEKQDWYSDGIADIVRTPNKILNAWFSQMVENRTLKNLNMNLFNSSIEGFAPQTWDPRAWGMYGIPVPGGMKIDEVFKQLPVADLGDSLDDISFVISMVEKATGATSTQQGVQAERQITLGEVKLALAEAKDRIKGMSKFYTQVWRERGLMFIKMIEAAHNKLDAVKIFKKGRNTNDIYSRKISPEDWMTTLGYRCKVWDQNEKNEQDMQSLEKITAIAPSFIDNPKFAEIKQRKELGFAGLTPEETNDVMEVEEEKRTMIASQVDPITGQPVVSQALPQQQLALPAPATI